MAHLVLYDGVCGLCDHFVQFLIRIDRDDRLRFAALQGPLGNSVLQSHGREATELSTVIVVPDFDPSAPPSSWKLKDRSDAAIFAIASTGGVYRALNAARLVPRIIRDAVYNVVARSRYRIFGRLDACPMPTALTRAKFLDFAKPNPAR